MLCRICEVQIQLRTYVLDHADDKAPTQQQELYHTHKEHRCLGRSTPRSAGRRSRSCRCVKQEIYILAVRPMTMETRCCKVFFPNYSKKKTAEDTLVPPLWGKRKKVFFGLFVHTAVRGGTCAFTLKIVNRLIKNSSGRVLTLSQPLGALGMEQFLWYPH